MVSKNKNRSYLYPIRVEIEGKGYIVWGCDLTSTIKAITWESGNSPPQLNRWWKDPPISLEEYREKLQGEASARVEEKRKFGSPTFLEPAEASRYTSRIEMTVTLKPRRGMWVAFDK